MKKGNRSVNQIENKDEGMHLLGNGIIWQSFRDKQHRTFDAKCAFKDFITFSWKNNNLGVCKSSELGPHLGRILLKRSLFSPIEKLLTSKSALHDSVYGSTENFAWSLVSCWACSQRPVFPDVFCTHHLLVKKMACSWILGWLQPSVSLMVCGFGLIWCICSRRAHSTESLNELVIVTRIL